MLAACEAYGPVAIYTRGKNAIFNITLAKQDGLFIRRVLLSVRRFAEASAYRRISEVNVSIKTLDKGMDTFVRSCNKL